MVAWPVGFYAYSPRQVRLLVMKKETDDRPDYALPPVTAKAKTNTCIAQYG